MSLSIIAFIVLAGPAVAFFGVVLVFRWINGLLWTLGHRNDESAIYKARKHKAKAVDTEPVFDSIVEVGTVPPKSQGRGPRNFGIGISSAARKRRNRAWRKQFGIHPYQGEVLGNGQLSHLKPKYSLKAGVSQDSLPMNDSEWRKSEKLKPLIEAKRRFIKCTYCKNASQDDCFDCGDPVCRDHSGRCRHCRRIACPNCDCECWEFDPTYSCRSGRPPDGNMQCRTCKPGLESSNGSAMSWCSPCAKVGPVHRSKGTIIGGVSQDSLCKYHIAQEHGPANRKFVSKTKPLGESILHNGGMKAQLRCIVMCIVVALLVMQHYSGGLDDEAVVLQLPPMGSSTVVNKTEVTNETEHNRNDWKCTRQWSSTSVARSCVKTSEGSAINNSRALQSGGNMTNEPQHQKTYGEIGMSQNVPFVQNSSIF